MQIHAKSQKKSRASTSLEVAALLLSINEVSV